MNSRPLDNELYKSMFSCSNEAQYIVDFDSGIFLDANPAFEKLTGYSLDEIRGKMHTKDIVAPESMQKFLERRAIRKQQPTERYELKIITKDKQIKPVEFSIKLFQIGEKDLIIGFARDLTGEKKLQETTWQKLQEIIKTNNRIAIVKEKLEHMYSMSKELLHIKDEQQIYEVALGYLKERSKLAYQEVNIYIQENDHLTLAYSTTRSRRLKIPLDSQRDITKIATGEEEAIIDEKGAIVPLVGIEKNIGVMEVNFPKKELEILNGSTIAIKSYQNIVETLGNIIGLVIENIRIHRKLFEQSIIDPLTNLHNRRYFKSKLDEEFKRALRYKRSLSLVMVDLNGFKKINDTMGHRQGDLVLQEAARIFKNFTRGVDIIARYGGDEFMLLLAETSHKNAILKANNLANQIKDAEFTNMTDSSDKIKLTISFGVASYDETHESAKSAEDLIHKADQAMYRAKRKLV